MLTRIFALYAGIFFVWSPWWPNGGGPGPDGRTHRDNACYEDEPVTPKDLVPDKRR